MELPHISWYRRALADDEHNRSQILRCLRQDKRYPLHMLQRRIEELLRWQSNQISLSRSPGRYPFTVLVIKVGQLNDRWRRTWSLRQTRSRPSSERIHRFIFPCLSLWIFFSSWFENIMWTLWIFFRGNASSSWLVDVLECTVEFQLADEGGSETPTSCNNPKAKDEPSGSGPKRDRRKTESAPGQWQRNDTAMRGQTRRGPRM